MFFGTPEIAVPSLQAIAQLNEYEIVGVGVFPDRKVGRKQILTPCPVKVAALKLKLPIFEIDSKAELKALFKNVECDLAIVIAFGLIFPKSVLETPPLGVVNVHFSLLPKYRGASPVQTAILDGLTESGITWQRMVKALDAGDVLWQTTHNIEHQNTVQIWQNFSHFTAQAFPEFLAAYTQSKIKPTVQIEESASFCGKFEKTDGHLNYKELEAAKIYNTWRAFSPWPGVNLKTKNGLIKLIDISLTPEEITVPIVCANNTKLWINTVQIPGKTPQNFKEILERDPQFLEI